MVTPYLARDPESRRVNSKGTMGYFGGTLPSLAAVFPMTPRLFWAPTSGDFSLLPPDQDYDSRGVLTQKEGVGKGIWGSKCFPEKPVSLWSRDDNRVKNETIPEGYLEGLCIWIGVSLGSYCDPSQSYSDLRTGLEVPKYTEVEE